MVALAYPLPRPVPVTRRYGDTSIRRLQGLSIGPHTGIDLGAPSGTEILAAAGGVVTRAGWVATGGGREVDVDHGAGVQTRYMHLSAIYVRVGQQVPRGQVLGLVGASGLAVGAHLHYEVWSGGRHIDPAPYLGGGAQLAGGPGAEMAVPDGAPSAFPLDPGKTCPAGYTAGTINPQAHGWLPFGPWFGRPSNSDGTVNACIRSGLEPGDNAATEDLVRVALPFTLEATLNGAVLLGGALLVYRGIIQLIKP